MRRSHVHHAPSGRFFFGLIIFGLFMLILTRGFFFWWMPFAFFWLMGSVMKSRSWGHCFNSEDDEKRKNDAVIVVDKRKNDERRYIETFDGEQLEVIREDEIRYV